MKAILNFFNLLVQSGEQRARKREEAYLAQSTDINDLEHRMRVLERKPYY